MTPRRVWRSCHVAATVISPWAMAVWYFAAGGPLRSLAAEAHFVYLFHFVAAITAGVLLVSSIAIRAAGRAIAASIPFIILWGVALAAALYEVHEFSGTYRCDAELCMPSFGVFLTAAPFALVVTVGVVGSVASNRAHNDTTFPTPPAAAPDRFTLEVRNGGIG